MCMRMAFWKPRYCRFANTHQHDRMLLPQFVVRPLRPINSRNRMHEQTQTNDNACRRVHCTTYSCVGQQLFIQSVIGALPRHLLGMCTSPFLYCKNACNPSTLNECHMLRCTSQLTTTSQARVAVLENWFNDQESDAAGLSHLSAVAALTASYAGPSWNCSNLSLLGKTRV